jgi:hypothetical protein
MENGTENPRVLGPVPLNNHSDGYAMRLKDKGGLPKGFLILKSDFSTPGGVRQSTGRLSVLEY